MVIGPFPRKLIMRQRLQFAFVVMWFVLTGTPIFAQLEGPFTKEDWPWWRGPSRDGVAEPDQKLPIKFGPEENVLWKTPIPGRGHSSPTIVGKRIYLTTADEKKQIQSVLCYDRESGKQLWKTDVHKGGFAKKGVNKRSSYASASVACDGKRLYINFHCHEAIHATALDLDGKILWQKEITKYRPHQGYGSSPALFKGLLYVNADNKGGGTFATLDPASGDILRKHARPKTPNYASPIILRVAGKDQLFLTGCDKVTSFHPITGKVLWEIDGATTECVTSTVTDGKAIITSGGYPSNHISAVLADGSGKVLWRHKIRVYVPSMVLADGHVYAVTDDGIVHCIHVASGEITWKKRLGGTFNASLVLVGDSIYAQNQDGQIFIYKANPEAYESIAINQLGEDVFATPTIVGNRLYYRVAHYKGRERQEYLYCIGQK